ncbi:MAG: hypothetical protein J6K25_10775 [Thermoguttaceae bacterium]|nr:hypothetical protein [Thermoguttaceae bacterium]
MKRKTATSGPKRRATAAVRVSFVVYFNASTAENQPKRGDFPPLLSVFLDGASARRRVAALKRNDWGAGAEFVDFNG